MLAAMPPTPVPSEPKAAPGSRRRDDACPGALRLHTADDGSLARIRLPGGLLGAAQARALADAAQRLGDGELHLTSRGNVQLRGLDGDCGSELAGLLRACGLLPSERHERVRNIVAGPLAGLDGPRGAHVPGWTRELDALLCGSARAAALSGRFLFALDDGRGDVASLAADVTLIAADATVTAADAGSGTAGAGLGAAGAGPVAADAGSVAADVTLVAAANGSDEPAGAPAAAGEPPSGEPREAGGHAVLVLGRGPAAVLVPAADGPRAALTAAETFLTAADAHLRSGGDRAWRTADLPPDRLPGTAALIDALSDAGVPARPVRHPLPTSGPVPPPGAVASRHGRTALSVHLPLGRASADQWRRLADVAERDGSGELRLTPWRGVVLPGLSSGTADARLRDLAAAGLVVNAASPWHGVGACTGLPGCAKSFADVREDAAATVHADHSGPAEVPAGGGLPVYWSGCERRCGRPAGAHVAVTAGPDGYLVTTVPAPGPPAEPEPGPVPRHLLTRAVAAARATAHPGRPGCPAPTGPPR